MKKNTYSRMLDAVKPHGPPCLVRTLQDVTPCLRNCRTNPVSLLRPESTCLPPEGAAAINAPNIMWQLLEL